MFKKIREQLFGGEPKKRRLEFPETIRFALPNEVPNDKNLLDNIKKSETANIVEGYTIKLKTDFPEQTNSEFEFYSEINIDNSRLWKLFIELTNFLPNEIALISGHIDDDELTYGSKSNKFELINFLNKFENELTRDTFLKFGLIFHSDYKLVEVFVDEAKYIKFWGSDRKYFENVMQNFGINNIENLEFIDAFPKVRFPLITLDKTAINTDILLELLKNEYK
jgi:hypothetical protein